jgi:predicted transcriptional regulator
MTQTLSIRIDSKTKKQLDTLSKRSKRSKSSLGAEAIAAFIENQEWQQREINEAIIEMDSSEGISHERVSKWLRSWGKAGELKPPR